MQKGILHAGLITLLMILSVSCSGGANTGSPVTPSQDIDTLGRVSDSDDSQRLWGLYDITFDPVSGSADVVPVRSADLDLNILMFLEPESGPPSLTIKNLMFDGAEVSCDVGITHPFSDFPKYTGFMVRGIVLTDGSKAIWEDPQLVMSDETELRLDNLDGYTRWYNPLEFPDNETVFSYRAGKLGDPNGENYGSTLNPYKLFADGLNELDDDLDLDEAMKSAFRSGNTNWRHYDLNFGELTALKFQYAVVASWQQPLHDPPQIPDDFPLGTLAAEPWDIETIEIINSLYNDSVTQGGELILQVKIKDFENGHLDRVSIESPGVFPKQGMPLIEQDGFEVTFELNVNDIFLENAEPFEIFITAVAPDGEGYGGLLPDRDAAMYGFATVEVRVEPQVLNCPEWPFEDDFQSYDCVWTPHGGEWWGIADSFLDAAAGPDGNGSCYEEDTGSQDANPNVSYVSSPNIDVPESDFDCVITINHEIDVDPVESLGRWAWDMVFVRVNGEKIFPTSGPAYEDNHVPWSFQDFPCWSGKYDMVESQFNIGTDYNGSTIRVEFVLDTFDYVLNCDPPFFGWHVDDIIVEFDD